RPFPDGHGSLVQRLGFRVPSLRAIDLCQSVQGGGNEQMIWTERALTGVQRSLEQGLGLSKSSEVIVDECQGIQGRQEVNMIWPERLLPDCQRSFVKGLSL